MPRAHPYQYPFPPPHLRSVPQCSWTRSGQVAILILQRLPLFLHGVNFATFVNSSARALRVLEEFSEEKDDGTAAGLCH